MAARARRLPRPAYLAVLALVLIVAGCWSIETGSSLVAGTSSPYGSGGLAAPAAGGAQTAPVVGPLPQPAPRNPTWTGALRVTDPGIDMSYQPPKVDTLGGTSTVRYSSNSGTLTIENQGPAAIWTDPRDPTYDECLALVNAQPLSSNEMNRGVPYSTGQGLCIITLGKTAMAFVRGIGEPKGDAVEMSAKRWPLS